jgi:hypothetical protein
MTIRTRKASSRLSSTARSFQIVSGQYKTHALFVSAYGKHHHSGIAMLTPEMLHYGRAPEVIQQRQEVLNQAYIRNPERFVRACPTSQSPPTAAWINPPILTPTSEENVH